MRTELFTGFQKYFEEPEQVMTDPYRLTLLFHKIYPLTLK
jgi:hypothetical protein